MIAQYEGTIKILSAEDDIIDSKCYYSKEGRRRVMELWKRDYPHGEYFLIYPFARLGDKATKEQKKKSTRIDIQKAPAAQRPPAVYDNSFKSLYEQ